MKKGAIRKYIVLVVMLLLIPLAFILTFNGMDHHFTPLPYFGDFELVNQEDGTVDTLWKPMTQPELIDENGVSFDLSDLKGNVWLMTFYSSSSPHISKITERLLGINFKYRNQEDIHIVSVSHKPQFDTPQRRRDYLKEVQAQDGKWRFLSGNEKEIGNWARTQFDIENVGTNSTVWLIDEQGYLRAHFNFNLESEVSIAIGAIAMVKKEIDLREYAKSKSQ